MIDLRNFTECSRSSSMEKNETYILKSPNGKNKSVVVVSLGDRDCSEVVKFIGNQVRVLANDDGEVVIARGSNRLSVKSTGRGSISALKAEPILAKRFPEFRRIGMKGKWEQTSDGAKVFLLTPTGEYEKDERIVTGHRLEDKR